jgi:hypothetical protein
MSRPGFPGGAAAIDKMARRLLGGRAMARRFSALNAHAEAARGDGAAP